MSELNQSKSPPMHWVLKEAFGILLFTTGASILVVIWYLRTEPGVRGETKAPVELTAANSAPSRSANELPQDPRPRPVDLSQHYNAALSNAWHFPGGRGSATLRALPQGVQEFGGVPFEIRGIVQLASARTGNLPQYPERSTNIVVGSRCRALHFLHATGWVASEGTSIGFYWVHYADGSAIEIPIVYGEHLREWHGRSDRAPGIRGGMLAWEDGKPGTKRRLYQCRWENPKPQVEVTTIDFVSAMTDCFPFLIAVTAE